MCRKDVAGGDEVDQIIFPKKNEVVQIILAINFLRLEKSNGEK